MGGLRRLMPVTFLVYAVGMLALSGFPLLFSGFWSKDGILHAAHEWHRSQGPFFLALIAAFLTAFYMMRQVIYVFFGKPRPSHAHAAQAHESPVVMLVPMSVLAVFAVVLGFVGTPAWPWFQSFLERQPATVHPGKLLEHGILFTMLISSAIGLAGLGLGWWAYGRRALDGTDILFLKWPETYRLLSRKFFVDEIYEASVVRFTRWLAYAGDRLDRTILSGVIAGISGLGLAFSWVSRCSDEFLVNRGFDASCRELSRCGAFFSRWQTGWVQVSLRILGASLIVLLLLLAWRLRAA
jgi:NADH-quinone oxidoreductase subunit L